MRLSTWDCVFEPDSLAAKAYGTSEISERHRHRYEFDARVEEPSSPAQGLAVAGTTPDAACIAIMKIPTHPFFLGCQFHPEFKSKPLEPHPSFATHLPPATTTSTCTPDFVAEAPTPSNT